MKAFVIKVKENCYWLGGFYGKNNYDDITRAKLYVNKTQAEKQCKLVNESYGHSAEIIEVTIAEGNLEQENKQLKERIQNILEGKEIPAICAKKYEKYEEKLTEKDKEIERLKQENDKLAFALAEEPDKDELLQLKQDFDILYNKTKERDASIRKQVCDEIRGKLEMDEYNTCENTAFCVYLDYLKEILDQIEQAKESMNGNTKGTK